MHRLKTEALLQGSVMMAWPVAAEAEVASALETYGACVGLALFQVVDILDAGPPIWPRWARRLARCRAGQPTPCRCWVEALARPCPRTVVSSRRWRR